MQAGRKRQAAAVVTKEPQSHAESALQKCLARVDRLDKLNGMIERLSADDWSASINRDQLACRLLNNPFHVAIQSQMKAIRLNFVNKNPNALDTPLFDDLGVSEKARQCSSEAASELLMLRNLEHQSAQTYISMMDRMSAEVPLCEEEVHSALREARGCYDPAKAALLEALNAVLKKKAEKSAKKDMKKGHLSETSICVLQDWLVSHFENPYPTSAEKLELVKMTGMSMSQINNWMSNARVRIWRPTVEKLDKK